MVRGGRSKAREDAASGPIRRALDEAEVVPVLVLGVGWGYKGSEGGRRAQRPRG
jgi:hypothetical protein